MKKLILALVFLAASLAMEANPICYFTYSQARRTVRFLNTQNELVIYCGHQYELETYVIVSDVWMERVNSRYYEVWLYGIDAYTGDEIFMPVDLSCVWSIDQWSNEMYNVASYLHFQVDAPYTTLVWTMPVYHGFVRVAHPAHYRRSYHYDIHRYGWRPAPEVVLPVYYMRPPTAPMPVVVNNYVPGRERPTVQVDNGLTPRPQPTTSRTASTPVRNSGTTTTTPTPNNGVRPGGNPSSQPATTPSTGTVNTRTGSTPTRTSGTSTSTGTTTTPTNTSTTRPSTTRPTSTTTTTTTKTTPSRTTTSRPAATTQPAASSTPNATSRTTSSSTRGNASTKSTTTTTQQRTSNGSNDRPASSTSRTSSTKRR